MFACVRRARLRSKDAARTIHFTHARTRMKNKRTSPSRSNHVGSLIQASRVGFGGCVVVVAARPTAPIPHATSPYRVSDAATAVIRTAASVGRVAGSIRDAVARVGSVALEHLRQLLLHMTPYVLEWRSGKGQRVRACVRQGPARVRASMLASSLLCARQPGNKGCHFPPTRSSSSQESAQEPGRQTRP